MRHRRHCRPQQLQTFRLSASAPAICPQTALDEREAEAAGQNDAFSVASFLKNKHKNNKIIRPVSYAGTGDSALRWQATKIILLGQTRKTLPSTWR